MWTPCLDLFWDPMVREISLLPRFITAVMQADDERVLIDAWHALKKLSDQELRRLIEDVETFPQYIGDSRLIMHGCAVLKWVYDDRRIKVLSLVYSIVQ